jgi:hypothetical protein
MVEVMTRRARVFLLCAMLAGGLAAAGWLIDRQTAAIVGPHR